MKKNILFTLLAFVPWTSGATALSVNETFEDAQQALVYMVTSAEQPLTVAVIGSGQALPANLVIPESVMDGTNTYAVTYVADNAFQNNTTLTSVTIASSVEYIGMSAFQSCTQLATVTIGTGMRTIADFAFNSCTALTSLVFLSAMPPTVATHTFEATDRLTSIGVPPTSQDAYKAASGWKNYADIIKPYFSSLEEAATHAIEALEAYKERTASPHILEIIEEEKAKIGASSTIDEVIECQKEAERTIVRVLAIYEEGYRAARAELPTDDAETGNAVKITKGEKSVTFTNPDKVEFMKK